MRLIDSFRVPPATFHSSISLNVVVCAPCLNADQMKDVAFHLMKRIWRRKGHAEGLERVIERGDVGKGLYLIEGKHRKVSRWVVGVAYEQDLGVLGRKMHAGEIGGMNESLSIDDVFESRIKQ